MTVRGQAAKSGDFRRRFPTACKCKTPGSIGETGGCLVFEKLISIRHIQARCGEIRGGFRALYDSYMSCKPRPQRLAGNSKSFDGRTFQIKCVQIFRPGIFNQRQLLHSLRFLAIRHRIIDPLENVIPCRHGRVKAVGRLDPKVARVDDGAVGRVVEGGDGITLMP